MNIYAEQVARYAGQARFQHYLASMTTDDLITAAGGLDTAYHRPALLNKPRYPAVDGGGYWLVVTRRLVYTELDSR